LVENGKTVKVESTKAVAMATRRFPSDFPLALYPGAELLDVTKNPDIGQTEVFGEIEPIKDSPSAIADSARKKLQLAGWTIKLQGKLRVTSDCVEVPAIRGKQ
jgi:hypothetical protein